MTWSSLLPNAKMKLIIPAEPTDYSINTMTSDWLSRLLSEQCIVFIVKKQIKT